MFNRLRVHPIARRRLRVRLPLATGLYKALMPTWNEADAQACGEREWELDANGAASISRDVFSLAVFQLAEV